MFYEISNIDQKMNKTIDAIYTILNNYFEIHRCLWDIFHQATSYQLSANK